MVVFRIHTDVMVTHCGTIAWQIYAVSETESQSLRKVGQGYVYIDYLLVKIYSDMTTVFKETPNNIRHQLIFLFSIVIRQKFVSFLEYQSRAIAIDFVESVG